ncbi:MAG: TRAP transporter small permease subunit [Alphaproteobacteria bacterium]|nr:TRAP transporter small permease subunit [Alphaproteobacteria bacterium]MCZ6884727.1 TRAP transporter small permease subunit [Alphaproteobacteria bacterium]
MTEGQGPNPVPVFIDRVNGAIGGAVAWCALALVAVQFIAVVQRYVFGIGWIWVEESVVYFHATLFMAGAAYTLLHEGHVRVDIFYRDASLRKRAWIDLLGTILFLWPVAMLILTKAWPYVWASWSIFERSPETSGIPAVFLLKTLILVFAALIALQGLSMAVSAFHVITDQRDAGSNDAGTGNESPT